MRVRYEPNQDPIHSEAGQGRIYKFWATIGGGSESFGWFLGDEQVYQGRETE